MRILYHYHHYNPRIEAVAQEIEILKKYFQGDLFISNRSGVFIDALKGRFKEENLILNKNNFLRYFVKKGIYKIKHSILLTILWLQIIFNRIFLTFKEKNVDLHHIYHPSFVLQKFVESYIFRLKKPVLLSVCTESFGSPWVVAVKESLPQFKKLAGIVVSDLKIKKQLEDLGLKNIYLTQTAIKINDFKELPVYPNRILRIVMASSPHSEKTFQPKGIPLLLEALKMISNIKVYVLWRKHELKNEFWKYVDQFGVRDKVELVELPPKVPNINQYLKDKHGMIAPYTTLASNKPYPHSLIDAMASGRAVLTSNVIPIAEIIQKEKCGVIFEPEVNQLVTAIEKFRESFVELSKPARKTAEKYFSEDQFIQNYQNIYQKVLAN